MNSINHQTITLSMRGGSVATKQTSTPMEDIARLPVVQASLPPAKKTADRSVARNDRTTAVLALLLLFIGTGSAQQVKFSIGANMKLSALSGNISADSAIINTGGTLSVTNSTLYLHGAGAALTKVGALNATVSIASYKGTAAQTIAADYGFQSYTINNAAGVAVTENITVPGTLTLTNGTVTVADGKTIDVTNNQPNAVSIASTAASITGRMDRAIEVGNSGNYQFTNLNTVVTPSASQPAATFSVISHPNTAPPTAPAGTYVKRYYELSPTPSNFSAAIKLEYLESENISNITESNLVLFRHFNSAWTSQGGTPNPANNFVSGGPFTAWSNWAIGDATNPLPIQLASFTATEIPNRGVRLHWVTLGEINNYGFYVQRKRGNDSLFAEILGSFIAGNGTTNEPHNYEFRDSTVGQGLWSYRLKQVDLDGTVHFTDVIQVSVLTDVKESAPIEFALFQNYPNPFNPTTTIKYGIPQASRVSLKIYNILGQVVKTLVNDVQDPGFKTIEWNSTNNFGNQIATGVYLYRIEATSLSGVRSFVQVKKMIVLK